MEPREAPAPKIGPHVVRTEGDDLRTADFKGDIAVVTTTDADIDKHKPQDNVIGNKAIDLSKLKKIVVKIDPVTGKKYIHKDGKRIEIVPQLGAPIISLRCDDRAKMKPAARQTEDGGNAKTVIINNLKNILNGTELPKLIPTGATVKSVSKSPESLKYHVLSVNVKKPSAGARSTAATMTDHVPVDKGLQTDAPSRKEVFTQTDAGGDPPFADLMEFILGDSHSLALPQKRMPNRTIQTQEDINKFQFFNDMRNALHFDSSGNLPIHDSVMRNNLKLVQRSCVVLRAIKKDVNVFNQQCYAPLHLAVIYNVDSTILKALLYHGADLQLGDPEGNTVLHLAIERRRSSMLKIFVNGVVERSLNLDPFNHEGFTPLILACLNQSHGDAKLLLEHGADANIRDMKSGRTALFHAAESHDAKMVELLMQYKADTKIRNFFGTSPHDAMFELDDIPVKIKFSILGRDHQRFQAKKRIEGGSKGELSRKKAKLETTPVLKKVNANDVLCPKVRRK